MGILNETVKRTVGEFYLSEYGKNKFVKLGKMDAPQSLKTSETEISIPNTATPAGGTAETAKSLETVDYSATLYNTNSHILAKFLRANNIENPAATVEKNVTLSKNYLYGMAGYETLNSVVRVSDDVSIIDSVESDDMGLVLSEEYSQETEDVIINYSIPANVSLSLFTDSDRLYEAYIRVIDVNNNNHVQIHHLKKIKLSIPGELPIIGGTKTFISIPTDFRLLADDRNPDAPYHEIYDRDLRG